MCFSTEASFVAAAAISGTGAVLIKKFAHDDKVLLAATPLLFGVQQAAEGVVWMALERGLYPNSWGLAAHYIFLFFAYMLWPVWIPMAFMFTEQVLWRKRVMGLCFFIGLGFFVVLGHHLIFDQPPLAEVIRCSISYGESNSLTYRLLYAFGGLVPFLISSLPRMWLLGVMIGFAFGFADYSYYYAFTSVWCFFAAIIAIGFFFVLGKENDGQA